MKDGMDLLVKDLKLLDEIVSGCYRGTNCSIHVGRLLARAEAGYYHHRPGVRKCPNCGGTGVIRYQPDHYGQTTCKLCYGTGVVRDKED